MVEFAFNYQNAEVLAWFTVNIAVLNGPSIHFFFHRAFKKWWKFLFKYSESAIELQRLLPFI